MTLIHKSVKEGKLLQDYLSFRKSIYNYEKVKLHELSIAATTLLG